MKIIKMLSITLIFLQVASAAENRFQKFLLKSDTFKIKPEGNQLKRYNRCAEVTAWKKYTVRTGSEINEICNEISEKQFSIFQEVIKRRDQCEKVTGHILPGHKDLLGHQCDKLFQINKFIKSDTLANDSFTSDFEKLSRERWNKHIELADKRLDCYDQLKTRTWKYKDTKSYKEKFSFKKFDEIESMKICSEEVATRGAKEIEDIYSCGVDANVLSPVVMKSDSELFSFKPNREVSIFKDLNCKKGYYGKTFNADGSCYDGTDIKKVLDPKAPGAALFSSYNYYHEGGYYKKDYIGSRKEYRLITGKTRFFENLGSAFEVNTSYSYGYDRLSGAEFYDIFDDPKAVFEKEEVDGSSYILLDKHINNVDFFNTNIISQCIKKNVSKVSDKIFSCVQKHLYTFKENLYNPNFIAETYRDSGLTVESEVRNKMSKAYTEVVNFCKSEQVQEIIADVDAQKCFTAQHKNNPEMKKEEAYINCSVHFNTAKLEDPNNYRVPGNNAAVDNAEVNKEKNSGDGSGQNHTKPAGATSNN